MKRKLTFLISAICCILLLSTLSIYFFLNCRQNAMGQTSDGVFSFERSDNPFYADYELAGEWEFYPDKLIFSANSDGNVPGNIESANPLTIFTDWYHNRLSVAPSEEYAKTLTSTLPNSDADKIFIPSSYAQPWKRQRMIGTCASYRTIIQVKWLSVCQVFPPATTVSTSTENQEKPLWYHHGLILCTASITVR